MSDAALGELIDGFIGQRAGARNDADISRTMDMAWHDADFALARRNDARTVRADEARAAVLKKFPDPDHVERRNAFGDADDEFDFRIGGFHDGIGRKRRWNEDDRRVGIGGTYRLLHGIKYRPALMRATAFAGSDAADDLGAIFRACLSMERAFPAGEALHDDASRFINQNAHKNQTPILDWPNLAQIRSRRFENVISAGGT